MKNKLLIICILAFSAVYSQNKTSDTTVVVLKNQIAKLVIKDLIKGDCCELELQQTRKLVTQVEAKVVLKDTIIGKQDKQIELYKELVKSQEKQIKTAKNKTLWSKILLYGSVILNGYLLWTKSN